MAGTSTHQYLVLSEVQLVGSRNNWANIVINLARIAFLLYLQVNQKLLYRESDWWDVGLVVQKARKQGTVC